MPNSTPTHLVVPITTADPPLGTQIAAAQAAGAGLVELRVDLINNDDAVATLLQQPQPLPIILTVRAADEGGAWDRDDAERIALIEHLGLLNPGLIDVELATWNRSANLRQKIGLVCATNDDSTRPRNRLILSHHDFQKTPADLEPIFDALLATPAHVIKAVFMPADSADALRVLNALVRYRTQRPTIAIAMGEAGQATRILAKKTNAYLSFASSAHGGSAPGQLDIPTLKNLYRWDALNAETAVFGIVGWPVTHSRSPHIHNAAMDAAGINGVYVPFPVAPEPEAFDRFMDRVAASPALDIRGLSVTLPHKQHAHAWLERNGAEFTDRARRCAAVNTLYQTPAGNWAGDNTDAAGISATLTACDPPDGGWQDQPALILGAGGVARAAVVALQDLGLRVTLANRSPEKAERLAAATGCSTQPWEQRAALDALLVVNCTSVGLAPEVDATPLPAEAWRAGMIAFDTIYNPLRTRFLRAAAAAGAAPVTGDRMFIAQAEAQYRHWHGVEPPPGVMTAIFAQAAAE